MPRHKKTSISFIEACEEHYRLQYTVANTMPVCSLFDVINGNFVIPEKTKPNKKTSSRRAVKEDSAFMTYRFRGYPTKEQESMLKQNIGAGRFIWNRMLSDYNTLWKEMGISYQITPADYKDVSGLEWLKDMDSSGLANVQLHLERARSDYFSGEKGKPHFKKKHVCVNSYTTNCTKNNIRIENGGVRLPKIKDPIKLSMHRPIADGGKLKNVTVTHEPDGKWYFSIAFEYPAKEMELSVGLQEFFATGDASSICGIGLDMSVPFLYVDSSGRRPSYTLNGHEIRFIKQYRKLEKRIAREQRRRSRMVKDSSNYTKQCEKIARLHAKAKHRRDDFLHQIAVRLVKAYDMIAIEDLDIAAMKKGLKLGKSVSDVGCGKFVQILEELCNKFGKLLIRTDRWYPSSKTCHHCGYIKDDLDINDRTYICPKCGHVMDRDKNAAINILEEGFRILNDNMIKPPYGAFTRASMTRPSVEGYIKPSLISTIA